MPMNIRLTHLRTPAGKNLSFSAATGMKGAAIEKVKIIGSFGVDAGNAPPATSLRGDSFSVVRTSQGLYTVTLGGSLASGNRYNVKEILTILPVLQKSVASALRAEPGTATDTTGVFQIRVVDAAGAVANPAAAGANERIHFEVTASIGAS